MPATCPTCGEVLDIPPEFAGRAVRCGACRTVFTPPDDGIPTLRTVGRRDSFRPDAPEPHRSNARVWGLAALTFLLLAPCVGGCGWFCVAMLFPSFESVADADGRFVAGFPGTATAVNRPAADGTPVRGLELDRETPPEKYYVFYYDLPPADARNGDDAAFDAAIERVVRDGRFAETPIAARESTTHDGHAALDVQLFDPERFNQERIVRLVRAGDRVYIAGVDGPLDPDQTRVKEFFRRFEVLPPPAAPPDRPKKRNPFRNE